MSKNLQALLDVINTQSQPATDERPMDGPDGRMFYDWTGTLESFDLDQVDTKGRQEHRIHFSDGRYIGVKPAAFRYIAMQLKLVDIEKPLRIHRDEKLREWFVVQ